MCVFLIQSSVKLGKILYIPQCVAKIYKEKTQKAHIRSLFTFFVKE